LQVEVRGVEQLAAVAKAMKGADKQLKRETYAALNRTVKPLTQAVKDDTGRYLPGAYAAVVSASLRIRAQRRGGRDPSLSLKATAKTKDGKAREVAALERGKLRHPLWGNRRHWFNQAVRPGFWTEPLKDKAPAVRAQLVKVLDELAAKIDRSV
jgi:hypothetical protein